MKNRAVIGSAGKMGFQIASLLLKDMALEPDYRLTLVDLNLQGLREQIKKNLTKFAERNINQLRERYKDNPYLISNEEIILAFVEEALNKVSFESDLSYVKNCDLIFEAIVEDVDRKVATFKALKVNNPTAFFFTNTSSIPIHVLEQKAGLTSQIIGFHFYNPPEVQKLVEVIVTNNTSAPLKNRALELIKRLNKTIVFSKDVAGFIGNGFFMRECLFAFKKLAEGENLLTINEATEKELYRPMGIFQLMDYVGLDIILNIFAIMKIYLPDPAFESPLLKEMISRQLKGGQFPDGSQKNGFFSYNKGVISGVYSLERKAYQPITSTPSPWKKLKNNPESEKIILEHLSQLKNGLSLEFLKNSVHIAHQLVNEGVASSLDDVDTVLKTGFYQLYGLKNIHA